MVLCQRFWRDWPFVNVLVKLVKVFNESLKSFSCNDSPDPMNSNKGYLSDFLKFRIISHIFYLKVFVLLHTLVM